MKKVLGLAVALSLILNVYLAFLLLKESDKVEAAVHDEMIANFGFTDLAYLLRHSGMTKERLLELSHKQPLSPTTERVPATLEGNRFYCFPLEVTFAASGTHRQDRSRRGTVLTEARQVLSSAQTRNAWRR